jgi:hypothetical protein
MIGDPPLETPLIQVKLITDVFVLEWLIASPIGESGTSSTTAPVPAVEFYE